MIHLLETSSCVALLRGKSDRLRDALVRRDPSEVAVSALTVAELEYGIARSHHAGEERERLAELLSPFSVVPLDHPAAMPYGRLRSELRTKGALIGAIDMLLAAQALSLSAVMITQNVKEFRRVRGLVVEDWTK